MDKPINLSDKDFLVRKLSVKLMMSEQIINAIITHQFASLHNEMKIHDIVELAGWGKFHFNNKKAQKRIIELEKILASLNKQLENPNANIKLIDYKIETTTDTLNTLKERIC